MRRGRLAAMALLTLFLVGTTAGGAQALKSEDPSLTFDDGPVQTIEYGQSWYMQATGNNAGLVLGEWPSSVSFTGGPSGYVPETFSYQADSLTVIAYAAAPGDARPLGAGEYGVTLTITSGSGGGTPFSADAQLIVERAALGIDLKLNADPSNPANAILSAAFTGTFVDGFFSTSFPTAPLTPAGTWQVVVTDAAGATVHELTVDRGDTDDVLAVSSYWSDVPPGEYTATAKFTPTSESADDFTIAAAEPVAYTATAPEGSTSTAAPAPPAPPEPDDAGLTLPLWVPIAAGVLAAGLLALLIVQIVRLVRLRRVSAAPPVVTA